MIILMMPRHGLPDSAYYQVVQVTTFPDGETSVKVPRRLWHDDVTLVGECSTAAASEAFLAAAYEIASRGPKSFTVVNTYFRHARSERESDGCAALAKFQARQWSGLGRVYPQVHLEFVDLHKDTILHYFEGSVVTNNLTTRHMLEEAVRKVLPKVLPKDMPVVYATVDSGGVYEARRLAKSAGVGFAHIEKRRLSGSETEVLGVAGDSVDGSCVVIFDDMIATGGSVVNAVKAYRARGAKAVYVAAVHGVFAGEAVTILKTLPGLDGLFVTDTHPNAVQAAESNPWITIVPVFPMFGVHV
jgi:ribose-phosphate pyrophosphokinase